MTESDFGSEILFFEDSVLQLIKGMSKRVILSGDNLDNATAKSSFNNQE